jgi:hypothetical protein
LPGTVGRNERAQGVVIVEGGETTTEELALEFSKIDKTNRCWQIRELDQSDIFLVKFPHASK